MTLDVARLRTEFPALAGPTAYFDGPGGTQTPAVVGRAVADTLTGPLSNRGTGSASQRNAEDAVRAFRSAYADLLGASPDGVVHGRSATQLTYDLSRTLAKTWAAGDNVVVSRLDHDANVRPWVQAAERAGVDVRWLELDPATSELDLDPLSTVVDDRTRLVAVTGASNLLGTIPPVRTVADRAHAVGALLHVDGVHLTAHRLPDLATLRRGHCSCARPTSSSGRTAASSSRTRRCSRRCTRTSCCRRPTASRNASSSARCRTRSSPGRPRPSTSWPTCPGVPPAQGSRRERLERSHAAVAEHETGLRGRLETGLADLGDRVVVHSRAADRTPTLFLTFPGRRSTDVAQGLLERDVLAPAGSFYALEPFLALGLDDDAGVRVGLAAYTEADEVDRLLTGLGTLLR